ncbi:MAG: uroporphyrinogen decarboxylase family protein [Armatimonadota bacterium]|nr:uroporphyrinogen decarboxylase family protein [Armatimonadota bacterium]
MALIPKERVRLAIAHQEPDRPPITIYVTPEIDAALRGHFGETDYRVAFEVDFRSVEPVGRPRYRAPEAEDNCDARDMWGIGYSLVANDAGGQYLEATDLTLGRLSTLDEVERYPWPNADDYDYSVLPELVNNVKDYAVCLGSASIPDIINGVGRGRGMAEVLVDIITVDEVGIAIIDRRVDFYYEWCRGSLEAAQGGIDILCLGEDLGSQKGPTMSPETFDSFFRPRIEKFIKLAHNYGAKAMMHSCGSTRLLQPRLIDMGLDVLDAVQPEPVGMDPEELKREHGDRLTYCGMISTQQTLPHGTVEQCRAEARHRIDVIGKGGGYIFAPAHCIQPDTPIENVLAIYEEVTGKRFT